MMEYITRPHVLSAAAATLLQHITNERVWMPVWADITKEQIDAFGELQRACLVESCASFSYRAKGASYVDTVLRAHVQQRNQELFVLYAGVDPLVAKYEGRYGFKGFRQYPWLATARVREAHLQHWQDVQETKDELKRAG